MIDQHEPADAFIHLYADPHLSLIGGQDHRRVCPPRITPRQRIADKRHAGLLDGRIGADLDLELRPRINRSDIPHPRVGLGGEEHDTRPPIAGDEGEREVDQPVLVRLRGVDLEQQRA